MLKIVPTSIACAALLLSGSVHAKDHGRDLDDHGKSDDDHVVSSVCYPSETTVITAAGVKTTVIPPCAKGSVILSVSGQSNPWDQGINPTMIYTPPGDAFPPVVVSLSTYGIVPGAYVGLRCTGGTTNAGGLPNTGCDGLAGFGFPPTDTMFQPACGTYYPSYYADPSNYPMYVFDVMGVFTNASGAVVGKPFFVTSAGENVVVPAGAVQLQLGMNDCLNRDNSPAPLTVKISY